METKHTPLSALVLIETAAERDHLRAVNAELLEALCYSKVVLDAVIGAHDAEPFRDKLDPARRFQNDIRNSAGFARDAIAKATAEPRPTTKTLFCEE
jgi:hypothetical protein